MTILLILALIIVPTVIGCGSVNAFLFIKNKLTKTDTHKRVSVFCRFATYFSTGTMISLAVAGAVNILSVALRFTVTRGCLLFALLMAVLFLLCLILSIVAIIKNQKPTTGTVPDKLVYVLIIIAAVLAAAQMIYLGKAAGISYLGDQTLETVNSFLATDRLYSVDPLTGNPYQNGYPFRLSLQCLPFFYSALTGLFSVKASVTVWQIMPVFWLFCGYCTFLRIADSLFVKNRSKMLFLIICQALLWCSNTAPGGTGFNIFHLGFSSVTVLELLLISWTIGTVLSGNYVAALLAIIVEPMVASTQFGVGACFFITLALFVITKLPAVKRLSANITGREGGNDGKN